MDQDKKTHRGEKSDEKQTKHDISGADKDNIEVIRTRDLKDPV